MEMRGATGEMGTITGHYIQKYHLEGIGKLNVPDRTNQFGLAELGGNLPACTGYAVQKTTPAQETYTGTT